MYAYVCYICLHWGVNVGIYMAVALVVSGFYTQFHFTELQSTNLPSPTRARGRRWAYMNTPFAWSKKGPNRQVVGGPRAPLLEHGERLSRRALGLLGIFLPSARVQAGLGLVC